MPFPGRLVSSWANGYDDADYGSDYGDDGIVLGGGWMGLDQSKPTYSIALPPATLSENVYMTSVEVLINGKGNLGFKTGVEVNIGGEGFGELPVAEGTSNYVLNRSQYGDLSSVLRPRGDGFTQYLDITLSAVDALDYYDLDQITVIVGYAGLSNENLARINQVAKGIGQLDFFLNYHNRYLGSSVVLREVSKGMQSTLLNAMIGSAVGDIAAIEFGANYAELASGAYGFISPYLPGILGYNSLTTPFNVFNWNIHASLHYNDPVSEFEAAIDGLADLGIAYSGILADDSIANPEEAATLNSKIAAAVADLEHIWLYYGDSSLKSLIRGMDDAYRGLSSDGKVDVAPIILGYMKVLSTLLKYDYTLGGGSPPLDEASSRLVDYTNVLNSQMIDIDTTPWHHLGQSLMAQDMQASDPWGPINPTTTFYQTDERATWWVEFVDVDHGFTFTNKWTAPNGTLVEWDSNVDDPATAGQDYWSTYRTGAYLRISAEQGWHDYCGEWNIEVSAVNPDTGREEIFDTKTFQLLESPAIKPSISDSHDSDSINFTASDNTHLKQVTINWNDGADHSQTWSDLYQSSVSKSVAFDTSYAGTVSYTITAIDTSGNTENESGSFKINRAPTDISLSSSSIAENGPAGTQVGTFSTVDPDHGNTFSYTLISGAGSTDNGSFSISGNSLQAAAAFDYETQDSYSIRIRSTDQGGLSVEKSFNITVIDVANTANEDSYTAHRGDVISIPAPGVLINDTDPGNDPSSAVLVAGPEHGTFSFPGDGSFDYTPNANYRGIDSFTYKVSDGKDYSNVATVWFIGIAPNLERAIRYELFIDREITHKDLDGITHLRAQFLDIASLEGIQHCSNLGELSLDANQISDLSPLAGVEMPNLWLLDLGYNQISDLSPLAEAEMPNLIALYLGSNQISDISPLAEAGLANLSDLDLSGNQISDLSPLAEAEMPNLSYLLL